LLDPLPLPHELETERLIDKKKHDNAKNKLKHDDDEDDSLLSRTSTNFVECKHFPKNEQLAISPFLTSVGTSDIQI